MCEIRISLAKQINPPSCFMADLQFDCYENYYFFTFTSIFILNTFLTTRSGKKRDKFPSAGTSDSQNYITLRRNRIVLT